MQTHGITHKTRSAIEREMVKIKNTIEDMDLLELIQKLENLRKLLYKIRGDIKILSNYPDTHPLAQEYKEYREYPIDDIFDIIDFMKEVIEKKYPNETIYGKKIDSYILKQNDLTEWYATLEIFIDRLVEAGYRDEY